MNYSKAIEKMKSNSIFTDIFISKEDGTPFGKIKNSVAMWFPKDEEGTNGGLTVYDENLFKQLQIEKIEKEALEKEEY